MTNALEIRGLCKHYDGFSLENIDLTLVRGAVMGLIGENGAGKTTLIKTVLDLVRPDSGEVRVLGGRTADTAVRERLGVVLEACGFPSHMSAGEVDSLLGRAYRAWDSEAFASYLARFGIDRGKKISALSKGMKMKLAIAAALSHGAELLILDEATSGLDPVVRDEVLDRHGILRCTAEQLKALDPAAVRAVKTGAFGCEALVRRDGIPENWPVEPVSIEQLMLFLTRGEEVK